MDVPFHSSGTKSRAHYAIVRKVESAPSVEVAEQYLFLEVKSIQVQLSHPKHTLEKRKECLIILLYCYNSLTNGVRAKIQFDFAFLHAINLAETGRTVEEKRIGYLLCSEIAPQDRELRILLINTLRKDLESENTSFICLALDSLISSPNDEVIPAVQSRLKVLLRHEYSQVRRRALLAFRSLSRYNLLMLEEIHGSILNGLDDADNSVVIAFLNISVDFFPEIEGISTKVNKMLKLNASKIGESNYGLLINIIKCLRNVDFPEENIPFIFEILQEVSFHNSAPFAKALILELFRLLAKVNSNTLLEVEKSKQIAPVRCIRSLLSSKNMNDNYLFLSCLDCIDVSFWANVLPDYPPVLREQEFRQIVQLMNAEDLSVRRKTLCIINQVDPTILDMQISLLYMSNASDANSVIRILEVSSIRYSKDSENYVRQVLLSVEQAEKATTSPKVFQQIIETVLTHIRTSPNFLKSCATHFINALINPDVFLGSSALVIITALATEFCGCLQIPPPRILSGLASRFKDCPPIVQEPCILAILRVMAECEDITSDVVETVKTVKQRSRRSIKKLCEEFISYLHDKDPLKNAIREASSSSLPDFMMALRKTMKETSTTSPTLSSRPSFETANLSTSLRYLAYDTPEIAASLRRNRKISSSHSRNIVGQSPPMTAGDLTLAMSLKDETEKGPPGKLSSTIELTRLNSDLIILEPPIEHAIEGQSNFQSLWRSIRDSSELRGWCDVPLQNVKSRLESLGVEQFSVIQGNSEGELKIVMVLDDLQVAIRLREGDAGSCMWRLRCADGAIAARIQTVLNVD